MEQFGENIWVADGPVLSVLGFRFPTRMAVIRLSDGGLFIWSPVGLTGSLKADIAALGPVRHIVAPNAFHHLYLADWHKAYPEAMLHAPPGLKEKRQDIDFDEDLGDTSPPAWGQDLDQTIMNGNMLFREVVFFHRASKTVLFTDLVQQYPEGWFSGFRALIAKLDLMVEPEPSVPRKFRLAFTGRKAALASFAHILDWPAEQVLMAHGRPVREDGQAFIERAFAWLAK